MIEIGKKSLMNHQLQTVMDDCACNAQDEWNRTDKKTQRANGDTLQQRERGGGKEGWREGGRGGEWRRVRKRRRGRTRREEDK